MLQLHIRKEYYKTRNNLLMEIEIFRKVKLPFSIFLSGVPTATALEPTTT